MNEALLVRFVSDGTMNAKGFSASYVAVDPFDGSEEEIINSESSESATPFPGSLKSIYANKLDNEETDDDEEETVFNEYDNYNAIKQNNKKKKQSEVSELDLID